MKRSQELVKRVMLEQGVPGAVVAVVRDGRVVWSEGLGLADVENHTPCTPDTGEGDYVYKLDTVTKGTTVYTGLWRPECSEGATRFLQTVVPIIV